MRAKILEISETVQITDSFRKREFVVEFAENPQYPEYIKFEMIQDKCDLLNSFSVGQEVEVHFNLKGRKWTDPQGNVKYFNSLQAWRVLDGAASQGMNATATAGGAATPPPSQEPEWLNSGNGEEGDLPF
ncbi:DUF3127 domain-containing protein [Cytophagales bacterium RKSG123]|nr:DUF3127 domain-containing protein [Xanthovirga aplysinae]